MKHALLEEYSPENEHFSDEEVLARAIVEPSFFVLLLERYQGAFLRKAKSILYNDQDAEDVVQEAFVKIYAAAPRFENVENGSFKAWAYKILMNTALTRYQKMKRERGRKADIDPEFYEMLPDKDSQFERLELSEYLLSVFSKMPEHFARILRLQFLEGLSQEEIAEKEGLSVGAVKTRVHRAKKEFKRISSNVVA